MDKILLVNACIRPESRTYKLAHEVLSQMRGFVEEVNLEKSDVSPLSFKSLQKRDMYVKNKDFTDPMFEYANQFAEADSIIIAAPYWDLSFPSSIKVYFEAVTINGITFRYTSDGRPEGLCKAKKIIYVTTAGGKIAEPNLGYDYVKAIAQAFYGIPDMMYFKAEGLDMVGSDVKKIMEQAIAEIRSSKDIINKCH